MSEQEMIARLGDEIERQCSIGAGTFSVDSETGLWEIVADLDPNALADAILTTLASRTPEGMVMVPREPTGPMVVTRAGGMDESARAGRVLTRRPYSRRLDRHALRNPNPIRCRMTDLTELAKRVESLDAPCRETDAEIAIAKGWQETPNGGWFTPPGLNILHHKTELPRYTASLDSAMTLVPEGWIVDLSIYSEEGSEALLRDDRVHPVRLCNQEADAATPALALTAACLRALAQGEG